MTFVYGLDDDPGFHFSIKFECSEGFLFGFSRRLASAGYSPEDAFGFMVETMIQALNKESNGHFHLVKVR